MVAAMRDSRLESADFIHSLLGFYCWQGRCKGRHFGSASGLPQRLSSGERADVSLYVSFKAAGKKPQRVKICNLTYTQNNKHNTLNMCY